jgi:hypothetical protein
MKRPSWLVLAIALAACGDGGDLVADARVDAAPSLTSFAFMAGNWEVTSRRAIAGGGEVETAARSTITPALGIAWKEQLVGERDGAAVETLTLYGRSERRPAWLIARGDGAAGTFDVLEGTLAAGRGEFTDREGARPDGGMTRVTLESTGADSFELRIDQAAGGGGFELLERLSYRRAGTGFQLPAPPAVADGCREPVYHELDFWLGDWDVMGARNDIHARLGGCIVEENWTGSERGTSFNMYDRRAGHWTEVWVDTNGNNLVMFGGWDGTRMRLESSGVTRRNRLTLTPNGDGTVRQLSEISTNGGATYMTNFDFIYRPR